MKKVIIDAKEIAVGRLGSYAAKELLKGNSVVVINSEEAVISGNKLDILYKIRVLRNKGGNSQNGPKFNKLPHRFVKRMIRGMLPWDRTKGQEAYKRLICHIGNGDLTAEELKQVEKLDFKKPMKYVTIKEIVKLL